MAETERLFDPSALYDPARRHDSDRGRQLEELRTADWYANRLRSMRFRLYDIRPELPLAEILNAYADELESNPLAYLDRHILRLELNWLVHDKNKQLSGLVNTYYPGLRSYAHQRRCPYNDPKYIAVFRGAQQEYKDQPAPKIIHSVGQSALFHIPSDQFKREMLRQNDMSADRNLDSISSYDFMPNQFLIARLWALRSVIDRLEQRLPPFEEAVQLFEERLRLARYQLKHPEPFRRDTCHSALHLLDLTTYVPTSTEGVLLAFGEIFRSQQAA